MRRTCPPLVSAYTTMLRLIGIYFRQPRATSNKSGALTSLNLSDPGVPLRQSPCQTNAGAQDDQGVRGFHKKSGLAADRVADGIPPLPSHSANDARTPGLKHTARRKICELLPTWTQRWYHPCEEESHHCKCSQYTFQPRQLPNRWRPHPAVCTNSARMPML